MRFRAFLTIALLLVAGPILANEIYIDFDKAYDFDKPKTFAWTDTPGTAVEVENPLLHSRIVNALEHYLTQGGLIEVSENPDVYVTYHASTEQETRLDTTHFGYGYPGDWGWGGYGYGHGYGGWGGGMSTSTTTVTTYEVGTLVVDVWDAYTKELIWRGTATEIMVSDKPDKMAKRINNALEDMVKKSRKLKEKEGSLGGS